ncbi:MAG: excinuclease ABC subunit UvrB [Elusimicrobia bacterium]|nr:excinuclease ABC subunit UvrB [Elusimicrobiota bacterium]
MPNTPFKLKSRFKPSGDQPQAVKKLLAGLKAGCRHQVLLGVTGSGKTFTAANAIAQWGRPVLVISHNKVLAAQLYAEFKSFFPNNAVEYFISYYDYYQPEAYIPQTDTYIEKDAAINEHIERLRLKATSSLVSRNDVIVVASVSSIYNIGDPQDVQDLCLYLETRGEHARDRLTDELIRLQYERNELDLAPGRFRVRGGRIEIFPPYAEHPVRVTMDGDQVSCIEEIHRVTGDAVGRKVSLHVYPAKHFVTPPSRIQAALTTIAQELEERLAQLRSQNKLLEAQRLQSRTKYDMAMMKSMGFCHGIENYSRHISGRGSGERPFCLLDYFSKDFLMLIDESHVTLPQVRGMYEGDRSRKEILIEHGFRLPSALDNRPLKFKEFESLLNQAIYISATPGPYELSLAGESIIEQIVRPTGLVDPDVLIHPIKGQMDHLLGEINERVKTKERVLITTLTKRMAEDLNAYLAGKGLRVRYLHSDIQSLERIKILKDLRLGHFDVLVGVNLLREGLDLPEVSLVAILDADKEGFLRSDTTIIQICGRAARHLKGKVIMYADQMTGSMKRALDEMERRRKLQTSYNAKNKITPRQIVKSVEDLAEFGVQAKMRGLSLVREGVGWPEDKKKAPQLIKELEEQMKEAAERLDFEVAAALRDQIFELKAMLPKTPDKKKISPGRANRS